MRPFSPKGLPPGEASKMGSLAYSCDIGVRTRKGKYSVNGIRYSEFRYIPSVGGEPALRLRFIERDSEY
jgi:hypothetical protein